MSDFFTNLLNRHKGTAVQVMPRPWFIFEQPCPSPDVNLETAFSLNRETSRTNEESEGVGIRSEDMGSEAVVFTDQDLPREKLADPGEEREDFFEISSPVLTPGRPESSEALSEFSEWPESVLNQPEPQSEEALPRSKRNSANKREGERLPHITMETNHSFFTAASKKSLHAEEMEHSPVGQADFIKPRKAVPKPPRGKIATKDRRIDNKAGPDERVEAHVMDAPPWLNRSDELCGVLKAPASASQPEPVINITIGRVEVRAVQAQTQKRAKEAAKPSGVMSLDEYLRQRDSRSRK